MKKLLFSVLIFTVVISTLGLSSNSNVSYAAESNSVKKEKEGNYSESFELDGVHYFYEDTEIYTLTITKASTGEETIVYKDKLSKDEDEIYYQYKPGITEPRNESKMLKATAGVKIKSLKPADVKDLKKIKEKVLNDKTILEKRSIKDFASLVDSTENNGSGEFTATATTTITNRINSALSSVYGSQYSFKYVSSLYKNGYYGYLYQHMSFSHTPKMSWWFDALAGIGIIATVVGTPISTLIGLAAWTSSAVGAYVLLMPTEFNKWNAYVYYTKEVKVASIYPYRSYYTRRHTAVTGSLGGAALSSLESSTKSTDYDNNSSILNTAIDNYIRYY